MARGRQQGYQNYSAKEELILCGLATKLLPTGRNMWIALAAEYNGSKEPNWRERDFDSLRRKFRKLYGKPKPTGNQGDRLSLRQQAILLVHETQCGIEKKGGVHTSHDGHDKGDDDAALMDEVNATLFADEVNRTFNGRSRANSVSTKGGGDINREQNNKQRGAEEEDDASVSSGNSIEGGKGSEVDTSEAVDASQLGGLPLPPVSELHGGESVSAGAVMTHQGLVPIKFAADLELIDAVRGDGEESDTQGDQARSRATRTYCDPCNGP
ncbi:hypothetical protein PF011_g5231 [Phytophthora fragariae]|uniref:DUF6818 domain-containing protein n=3 Tax=Phytophthora fragariae TaxID=53985 RepID=A0A6A3LRS8_9STRA|nr:hypothetical protein PF011_g5231 [Phytophthora fragariae]